MRVDHANRKKATWTERHRLAFRFFSGNFNNSQGPFVDPPLGGIEVLPAEAGTRNDHRTVVDEATSPQAVALRINTPKALDSEAQGRAAHPGMECDSHHLRRRRYTNGCLSNASCITLSGYAPFDSVEPRCAARPWDVKFAWCVAQDCGRMPQPRVLLEELPNQISLAPAVYPVNKP